MHSVTNASRARRAFTLIELMVVIAIISVVSVISTVAFRALTKDARISTAKNTVLSSVRDARATALRTAQPVAVVFAAAWDPENPSERQVTQCILMTWGGIQEPVANSADEVVDVFRRVPDAPVRSLPAGMKVAAPFFAINSFQGPGIDYVWLTQPEFQFTDPAVIGGAIQEFPGEFIGILFDGTGRLVTSNVSSFAREALADLSGDDADGFDFPGPGSPSSDWLGGSLVDTFERTNAASVYGSPEFNSYYHYNEARDEGYIQFAPYVAVYDDDEARELKQANWTTRVGYEAELAGPEGYIAQFGQRLDFNRFTGITE